LKKSKSGLLFLRHGLYNTNLFPLTTEMSAS